MYVFVCLSVCLAASLFQDCLELARTNGFLPISHHLSFPHEHDVVLSEKIVQQSFSTISSGSLCFPYMPMTHAFEGLRS